MKKLISLFLIFGFLLFFGCAEKETTKKQVYEVGDVKILSEKKENFLSKELESKPMINPGYTENLNENLYIYFLRPYNPKTNGEAILLKKGDLDILIDTTDDGDSLVRFLQDKGVDDIELLILTSPVEDRIGGAETLLRHMGIESILINPVNTSYGNILGLAETYKIPIDTADYLYEFSKNGISFLVINPTNDPFYALNNDGVCLIIKDRNFSMMTTADIAYGAETKIVDSTDFDKHVRVLQIPNHGLGQATTKIDLFLDKIKPEYAIVTGSYYDLFNMHYTIHEKLGLKGIEEYTTFDAQTESLRTIKLITDGNNISIFYESD